MCNGFGGFYSKSGKVYFTTPDDNGNCSHSDTASRLPKGAKENGLVPFEIPDWSVKKFNWDTNFAPEWANANAKKICVRKMKEVKPFWAEYKKGRDAARAEYEKVIAPARAEFISHLKQIDGYCQEA